jgi:tetratricopeptide (TPR) repeat protein
LGWFILILVIVLGFVTTKFFFLPTKNHIINTKIEVVPKTPTSIEFAPNSSIPSSVLKEILVSTAAGKTLVRFPVSQAGFYRIGTDNTNQRLFLTLENTHLSPNLKPIDYDSNAIEEITLAELPTGDLKITINLTAEASLTRAEMKDNELQLDLFKEAVPEEKLVATAKPKVVLKTPTNEVKGEIQILQIQAQDLIEKNKLKQALSLLESQSPPIAKNLGYYSTMAALYQRLGQPRIAISIYKQLLSFQPRKGIWLMGLGIALDAEGKHNDALESFRRASKSTYLSPTVKAFLDLQLQRIG